MGTFDASRPSFDPTFGSFDPSLGSFDPNLWSGRFNLPTFSDALAVAELELELGRDSCSSGSRNFIAKWAGLGLSKTLSSKTKR